MWWATCARCENPANQMKKGILAALISTCTAATALAQGTIIFENSASAGNVYVNQVGPYNYAAAGSYTVALLWAPGNAVGLPQSAFTQIAIYGLATGEITHDGYFIDTNVITTGTATAPGTVAVFEVQGWIGNFNSYAAAAAAGAKRGQSGEFLNATGIPGAPGWPPFTTPDFGGGWDGNLILVVPEPGSVALCGVGAAALLFFRRIR